jgi:hypothetical protein
MELLGHWGNQPTNNQPSSWQKSLQQVQVYTTFASIALG